MKPRRGFQTLERAGKWIPNTLRVQRITYAHGTCQAPSFALLSYGPVPPGHPSGKGAVFSICAVVQSFLPTPTVTHYRTHTPTLSPKLNSLLGRYGARSRPGAPITRCSQKRPLCNQMRPSVDLA
jgi:hypothetical protein